VDDRPENIVVEEVSKGYKVGDRVIKPAKVLVSKRKENELKQESKEEEKKEKIEGGEENGENNRN
ncbi:MAG: nucleotide exchange factor GrpE, partial [candidate division WOR-3 bacterium]